MAVWKKVVVSGSDISQLNNDLLYIHTGSSGVALSGSFSGSFQGDGSGLTGVTAAGTLSSSAQIAADISGSFTLTSQSIASDIASLDGEVTNLMASTGSVYSHVSGLLSSTGSNYAHITNLNSFTGSFSSSIASEIAALESFSSSLDATFATEAEVNTATASLSASLAADISTNENNITALDGEVTNLMASTGSVYSHVSGLLSATGSNYAHITNLNSFTGSFSSSVASEIAALEAFSSSLDATFASEAELNTATASLSSSLAADIATNLNNISALDGEVTNLMAWTGSASRRSDISGSFTLLSASIAADIAGVSAGALESGSYSVTLKPDTGSVVFTDGLEIGDVYGQGSGTTDIRVPNGASWIELNYADTDFIYLDGTDAGITLDNNYQWTFYGATGTFIAPGEIRANGTISGSTFVVDGGTIVSSSAQTIANLAGTNIISGSGQLATVANVATTISGSSTILSSSLASRLETVEGNVGAGGLISGAAQIASEISGSFTLTSASIAADIVGIKAVYATTGSNYFNGSQVITGSLYITSDLIVQGSSSLQNITASAVDIGTNTVLLNTDTPAVRFGGIKVIDSGSGAGASGSLLWDSQYNRWIYEHPAGAGEGYNSAILIAGPKHTGALGGESTLTQNKITLNVGEDHVGDSIMTQAADSSSISVAGQLSANGFTGSILATNGILSSSAQIASNISGSITIFSSSIAGRVTTEENNVDIAQAHISNIHAFTASADGEITSLMAFTGSHSSSVASRITNLEVFSSSLDASYVTEAELVAATASLSSSLASDITTNVNNIAALDGEVTNLMAATGSVYSHVSGLLSATGSNYAHITNLNSFTGSFSSSVATEIAALEAFSSSLNDNFATDAEVNTATASLSASLATDIATLVSFSSSLESTIYNYTGSFSGDGSGLSGIVVSQNATVTASFTNATTASIIHNFNSDNVIVTVYDQYNQQFIPATIWTKTEDEVEIHFEGTETGRAVVARGGHIVSGSIPFSNIIALPSLISSSAQIATDISGSFTLLDGEVTSLMAFTGSFSSSIASEIAALEAFSSSLDAGFVTEAELVAATASLSSSLATSISTKADKTAVSGAFAAASGSFSTRVTSLESSVGAGGLISSSAQIASDISGSFTLVSSSIATNIATNLSSISTLNAKTLVSASVLSTTGQGEVRLTTNGLAGSTIDLGLQTTDTPTFAGLTITGDLVVTGNTVEAQVTNLNVEDKYILLNSGSSSGDSGIVFGGADGVANSGVGLFWDTSYNSNDGRLGIVNSIAAGATGDQTPSYHIAGVFEGTEANAATAQADHVGNIRVESGEIYIYV